MLSRVTRSKAYIKVFGLAAIMCLALAGSAFAQTADNGPTVDYTSLSDPAKSQFSSALVPALTFLGIVGGVLIGIGLFRKVTGVKKPASA